MRSPLTCETAWRAGHTGAKYRERSGCPHGRGRPGHDPRGRGGHHPGLHRRRGDPHPGLPGSVAGRSLDLVVPPEYRERYSHGSRSAMEPGTARAEGAGAPIPDLCADREVRALPCSFHLGAQRPGTARRGGRCPQRAEARRPAIVRAVKARPSLYSASCAPGGIAAIAGVNQEVGTPVATRATRRRIPQEVVCARSRQAEAEQPGRTATRAPPAVSRPLPRPPPAPRTACRGRPPSRRCGP